MIKCILLKSNENELFDSKVMKRHNFAIFHGGKYMEYYCILIQLFAVIQTDFKIIELWDFDDCESHG